MGDDGTAVQPPDRRKVNEKTDAVARATALTAKHLYEISKLVNEKELSRTTKAIAKTGTPAIISQIENSEEKYN